VRKSLAKTESNEYYERRMRKAKKSKLVLSRKKQSHRLDVFSDTDTHNPNNQRTKPNMKNEKNKKICARKKSTSYCKGKIKKIKTLHSAKIGCEQVPAKKGGGYIHFGRSQKVAMVRVDVDIDETSTELLLQHANKNMTAHDKAVWALENILTEMAKSK